MFFMHHKHMQRLRPPLPDCEAYLKCLIEQCWQHAPEVFLILCWSQLYQYSFTAGN